MATAGGMWALLTSCYILPLHTPSIPGVIFSESSHVAYQIKGKYSKKWANLKYPWR